MSLWQLGVHCPLASQFARAIHVDWLRTVRQVVRVRTTFEATAEHVVGGYMDQPGAGAGAGPRNISGADRVRRVGAVGVGLRGINGGVGRAVDHHVT
jgi:hypothetical protein